MSTAMNVKSTTGKLFKWLTIAVGIYGAALNLYMLLQPGREKQIEILLLFTIVTVILLGCIAVLYQRASHLLGKRMNEKTGYIHFALTVAGLYLMLSDMLELNLEPRVLSPDAYTLIYIDKDRWTDIEGVLFTGIGQFVGMVNAVAAWLGDREDE